MPNTWGNGARKRGARFIVLGMITLLSFFVFLHLSPAAENEPQAAAVVQDNDVATKHLKKMREELISLSKTHRVLRGIDQDRLRDPASSATWLTPVKVLSSFDCPKIGLLQLPYYPDCGLCFGKNMVMLNEVGLAMSFLVPKSNGIRIDAIISANPHIIHDIGGADECWDLKKGGVELTICYRLMIGENLKALGPRIREILHRNLQAMWDELQQQCGWTAGEHWAHEFDNNTVQNDNTIIPTRIGVGFIVAGLVFLVFLRRRRRFIEMPPHQKGELKKLVSEVTETQPDKPQEKK